MYFWVGAEVFCKSDRASREDHLVSIEGVDRVNAFARYLAGERLGSTHKNLYIREGF